MGSVICAYEKQDNAFMNKKILKLRIVNTYHAMMAKEGLNEKKIIFVFLYASENHKVNHVTRRLPCIPEKKPNTCIKK